jgi:hypothetical protein
MWTANILIGIAGAFLIFKSVKETLIINFSFLRKIIPKQLRGEEEEQDENT